MQLMTISLVADHHGFIGIKYDILSIRACPKNQQMNINHDRALNKVQSQIQNQLLEILSTNDDVMPIHIMNIQQITRMTDYLLVLMVLMVTI